MRRQFLSCRTCVRWDFCVCRPCCPEDRASGVRLWMERRLWPSFVWAICAGCRRRKLCLPAAALVWRQLQAMERPWWCRRRFPASAQRRPVCRDRPKHGFCSFFRRANSQSLPRTPPFWTSRRAVRLDVAAGDGKLVRNWTGGRHFLENALPDTALGPTIVAVVDGRRWPKGWRNVAPAASCFQHMQDAGNDSPIVHARFSRLAVR